MRISVVHSTTYQYDVPVFHEPHTFRFRPREDPAQHLRHFSLEIWPTPAGKTECLDQDGNAVVEAWFDAPVGELAIRSSFEVDTLRENPFDFVLSNSNLMRLPLAYQPPLRAAVAPYLTTETEPEAVCELAREAAETARGATLGFLTEPNRRLFENFQHILRDDGAPLSPEVTLREQAGSCRDMAVLFCSACRVMGIPARFVSGYEREAAFQEPANIHAWAEVYLAGGGWRGYDPSAGLAVSTSHVTVAAAADPRLASPISGSYRGSAGARMQFQISMQVGSGGE